jgi:hypothetical protein
MPSDNAVAVPLQVNHDYSTLQTANSSDVFIQYLGRQMHSKYTLTAFISTFGKRRYHLDALFLTQVYRGLK